MRAIFINENILQPKSKDQIEKDLNSKLQSKGLNYLLNLNPHHSIRSYVNSIIIKKINDLSLKEKIKYIDLIRDNFRYSNSKFIKLFVVNLIKNIDDTFEEKIYADILNLIADNSLSKEERFKLRQSFFNKINTFPSNKKINFYFYASRFTSQINKSMINKLFKEEKLSDIIKGYVRIPRNIVRDKLNSISIKQPNEVEEIFKKLSSSQLERFLSERDNLFILARNVLSGFKYNEKDHDKALIRGVENQLPHLIINALKAGADVIWIDSSYIGFSDDFDSYGTDPDSFNREYIKHIDGMLRTNLHDDIFIKIIKIEEDPHEEDQPILIYQNILNSKRKSDMSLEEFVGSYEALSKKQFEREIKDIEKVIEDMKNSYNKGTIIVDNMKKNILSKLK